MKKKILPVIFVCFCVMVLVVYAQDALHVFPTGNVGIGVEDATAKLEVGGRIKDKSGFIMPVGSVLPFFGDQEPEGWLLCDGREVNRNKYADLFSVIGTACGHGDETITFNIPDLRGMFLRGVDDMNTQEGAAARDPDAATREELKPGGNTGNSVGSRQEDAFENHEHDYQDFRYNDRNYVSDGNTTTVAENDGTDHLRTTNGISSGRTSNETRPKNVAVHYIIKY